MAKQKKIYVYDLEAVNGTGKTQIKNVGYSYTKDYQDGEILINGNTNIKEIMENIYVRLYKSKLTAEYLQSNKKISFMYASVFYQKKFVTGHLLDIVVYFDISTDTKIFRSFEELLAAQLEGKYMMEIGIGETKKIIDIENIYDKDDVVNQVLSIVESDIMKNIINIEMSKRDKERVEKYGKMVSDKPKEPKYKFDDLVGIYEQDGNMDRINKMVQ